MRKSDIQLRRYYRESVPAINVKCYHFGPSVEEIMARFGCDKDTAQRALEFSWESAVEQFWRDVGDIAREIFPDGEVYSDGRSSGWLIVTGLLEVESWDAVMLAKWAKFARLVESMLEHLRSDEAVLDEIEANQWAKPGAELYNFIDDASGKTQCIADLKAAAIAAGYGAVVR